MRILNEMRAGRILELPLDYIYNEDFDQPHKAEEILGDLPEADTPQRRLRVPSGLPPSLAALYDVALLTREQDPLVSQNELPETQSGCTTPQIIDHSATAEVMDEIERLYEHAVRVKNQIVQANLRLVVSIAKRHMSSSDDFFSLVSDGNMSLVRGREDLTIPEEINSVPTLHGPS